MRAEVESWRLPLVYVNVTDARIFDYRIITLFPHTLKLFPKVCELCAKVFHAVEGFFLLFGDEFLFGELVIFVDCAGEDGQGCV